MRRTLLAVPAVVFGMTLVALAQKSPESPPASGDKEKKSQLEDLLAQALQHSPDVQVAEAKVKEAEAQLRQARMIVATKLVEAQSTLDQQRVNLTQVEKEWQRVVALRAQGSISQSEIGQVEAKLVGLKAQVAQHETMLNALLGKQPFMGQLGNAAGALALGGGLGFGGGMPDTGPKPRLPRQPMADRLRKALDQPLKKLDKPLTVPLREVINYVREQAPGAPILANLGEKAGENVNIDFKGELTLGAFFQVLGDSVPDLRVYVRDYGFLIIFDGYQPNDVMNIADFVAATGEPNA